VERSRTDLEQNAGQRSVADESVADQSIIGLAIANQAFATDQSGERRVTTLPSPLEVAIFSRRRSGAAVTETLVET
jgi:hypothetical protein